MNEWDATSYAGKDTILRVVREEAERLFALAEPEEAWEAPTACTGWTTRDVVAHIVDTTEGYFAAFDAARGGGDLGTAYGLPGMGDRVNAQALALRGVPQKELLDRLRADFERMQTILRGLGEDEWAGLTVPHFYMGPLPAYFYAAGQLMDYAVHSWDVRQGSGRAHGLPGEAADLLVPFMFVLWQSTIRQGADLTPFEIGIRVGGVNGGDFRVSVGARGMTYEPGKLDGLPAVIEFDAGSMVLTTFGRSNSGTVRGDLRVADRYLNLFFRI
ncbi:maleylpyruvate isomerase family mycothiol-dependent enzyme [Nonomuraea sp. PA05]|uniref:maleylpyruvate isomerase family mycothiol-dependent enzyme n=1 Tax=Nonomuraea sp. PA05 TaxID=2604466 RepID=UPI0011D8EBC0|nr:maleylpyruvate isomerase family mycothiol-dependent enzyme [Nonomuraea sp. PA05]TYB63954.1 maleylpyruvate isomerase family mycothiol-dependent enzyme [Nonomuraea sp. PA05]